MVTKITTLDWVKTIFIVMVAFLVLSAVSAGFDTSLERFRLLLQRMFE